MQKKPWEFEVTKERIVNHHTGVDTNFFGLFRNDNKELIHISGKSSTPHIYSHYVDFAKKLCEQRPMFKFDDSNVHIIRDGRIMVIELEGGTRVLLDESEAIQYNISIMVTLDSSYKVQACVNPIHKDTDVVLPSRDIPNFIDFYSKSDIDSLVSSYNMIVDKLNTKCSILAHESYIGNELSIRSILKDKFFPNHDSENEGNSKSITREKNRFNDVINGYVAKGWVSESTKESLWRLFIEINGRNQNSWSRSISEGETKFSNIFGNTQRECTKIFSKLYDG